MIRKKEQLDKQKLRLTSSHKFVLEKDVRAPQPQLKNKNKAPKEYKG